MRLPASGADGLKRLLVQHCWFVVAGRMCADVLSNLTWRLWQDCERSVYAWPMKITLRSSGCSRSSCSSCSSMMNLSGHLEVHVPAKCWISAPTGYNLANDLRPRRSVVSAILWGVDEQPSQ